MKRWRRPVRARQVKAEALDRDDQVVEHASHGLRCELRRRWGRRRRWLLEGGLWLALARRDAGCGGIGADREAVVPGEAAATLVELVAAAVGEALGSGGCGGGGFGGAMKTWSKPG